MQNLAQVTADLMTALEIPAADVVGHDWGRTSPGRWPPGTPTASAP
ncbi:hypothetical protein [Blastococcus brunescens]|uniref:Uncharacterized protein n=1 Tax=Blastococcus brunescens TaxID=1564165 RepID=A0ABZ1AW62_9ACTN|nr:hypothetical protein [Blastococcus sp. BMG 8361]WRL62801.1 hypothetical protein U6N30_23345 [Blastococcus sp. BMG 8361]